MGRLTHKDEQGNWALKGVKRSDLYEGRTITKELFEKLYGALWKLMEYEDTGLTPEEIEELNKFENSNGELLLKEIAKHEWIPVEDRLPKEDRAVLICREGGAQDVGWYEENVWWTGFSHADIKSDIVAWQPLPKPYRRED